MRKLALSTGIFVLGASLAACSDDPPKGDGSVVLDGGGEGVPAGQCDKTVLGLACVKNTDCSGGNDPHRCLLTGNNGGVCVCTCTPDDSSTPVQNEDSCPDLSTSTCGTVALASGSAANYCFKICKPKLGANDCQGKIACHPRSGAVLEDWDNAVCFFEGCTKDSDCPIFTSTRCDTVKKDCPTGEECVALATGSVDGVCAKPGTCDTPSGLCDVKPASLSTATAKVGDACQDDTQCAANQRCELELDLAKICLVKDSAGACTKFMGKAGAACTKGGECCSNTCTAGQCAQGRPCGVLNRNGYCITTGCVFSDTLTQFKCDAGSICSRWYAGGVCFKKCALSQASDCRGNAKDLWGDYECRSWDSLAVNKKPVAAGPYCEPGFNGRCGQFKGSSTLDCSALGDKANTTTMSCRTLDDKPTTDKFDPSGFCFDDTASGTAFRSPLP